MGTDDEFDEFADFEEPIQAPSINNDNEFGDFAAFDHDNKNDNKVINNNNNNNNNNNDDNNYNKIKELSFDVPSLKLRLSQALSSHHVIVIDNNNNNYTSDNNDFPIAVHT